MKRYIKKSLTKLRLYNITKKVFVSGKRVLHYTKQGADGKDNTNNLIFNYLQAHKIRKLHLGCGNNLLDGWLNSDVVPVSQKVIKIDVTKPFPIENQEFNFIFSEHLIEHINYSQGTKMLAECYRVLRNNGKIRISTPDLAFLMDLGKDNKSDVQKRYINFIANYLGLSHTNGIEDTFIINNFFYGWGHQFIYNEITLRDALEKTGFTKITRCELSNSSVDALKNLENVTRMPFEYLELETFTLEGTKLI